MHLLTLQTAEGLHLGVETPEGIVDLTRLRRPAGVPFAGTPEELCSIGSAALSGIEQVVAADGGDPRVRVPLQQATLGPCVPKPGKIICIAINYRAHADEANFEVPKYPVLFAKYGTSINASGAPIHLLEGAEQFDYEAELGVVIGRTARSVSEAEALDYVLGYCNANDVTARDLQFRTAQWLLGKTPDGFAPVGPYLVTRDELPEPQNLMVRCWVNGELRQEASTSKMIFGVRKLISYISHHMTLQPGDLILTGTPEGVILGMDEKKWLKAGDVVEVAVEGLGRLTNTMAPPA